MLSIWDEMPSSQMRASFCRKHLPQNSTIVGFIKSDKSGAAFIEQSCRLCFSHWLCHSLASILSFLLLHCHVTYIFIGPQNDLLHMNLSTLVGLVKLSARFSLVWIFYLSTHPSSTTSRTKWYCTLICFVLKG